jgi:bifunctional UDP-N-acetylglucosamine pyrophosphorylase/glucosamine-1-phosphate N-acetyltransferase
MLKKYAHFFLGTALIMNQAHATDNVEAVILAAGVSSRFGKPYSKMLAEINNMPMIVLSLEPLQELDLAKIVIVGHQREQVMKAVLDAGITNVQFAPQNEQRGTGHAVLCAQPFWSKDNILITNGDMPLIKAELIEQLYLEHKKNNADITFIVAHNVDPACAYGRIVPDQHGTIAIVEKKHFTHAIEDFPLVNAGIYLVKRPVLEECLQEIKENSVSHEFYVTDIVEIAAQKNLRVVTIEVPFNAVRGINTQEEYNTILALVAEERAAAISR